MGRFRPEIHRLRGVAIVLVVLGHCLHRMRWGPSSRAWSHQVFCNGSLLFVFIAGYLLWHLRGGKPFDHRRYLRKKAQVVVTPYLIWSIPILLALATGLRSEPAWVVDEWSGLGPGRVVVYLITGAHLGPLWFIPMIIVYYLVAPLWLRLGASRWIWVALAGSVVLSLMVRRVGMSHETLPPLRRSLHFASPFILGMALARHRAAFDQLIARRGVKLVVGLTIIAFAGLGASSEHGRSFNYVQKMLVCLLALPLLARVPAGGPSLVLGRLATLSFGIFFTHQYVLLPAIALSDWVPRSLGDAAIICGGTLGLTVIAVELLRWVAGSSSRLVLGTPGRG